MRLLVSLAVGFLGAATLIGAPAAPYFAVLSTESGPWPDVLSSIGLQARPASAARIFVARAGAPALPEWNARIEQGAVLILEGESSLAEMFGFRRGPARVRVGSIIDAHNPGLPLTWEKALELPVFAVPGQAKVYARERWTGAPVTAGLRLGAGAVLWVAVSPGERGYERLPYVLNALCDLGVQPPLRSSRLWAFFDSSYRLRVDVDYFAERWSKLGIAGLHVAAWHFFEPDKERDAYLTRLIEACHRKGILVYAWLELPHVSEKFWQDHPEWREKTAIGQDAQLDWRKLMNLLNPDCAREARNGVAELLRRFDWDGVNLAELYFESLEGVANPARFTPMNGDARALFKAQNGFDPIEIFGVRADRDSRKAFLDFRSGLAQRLQEEWIGYLDSIRRDRPYLELVLTHVDDRFDTTMRDAIGADAARLLPLMEQRSFTFLIEDPATVWNEGSRRYRKIGEAYQALTPHRERLAIDLNIVDRYQDVYPARQQTGLELLQLVHEAASAFQRVALYFENSILQPDLALLPAAAAGEARINTEGNRAEVQAETPIGVNWRGAALVDGQPWPVFDGETLWLPAGAHSIEAREGNSEPRILRFNGELKSARVIDAKTVEFSYESVGRSIVVLDRAPKRVKVDGAVKAGAPETAIMLPEGRRTVVVEFP